MSDTNYSAQIASALLPLREPIFRSAIEELQIPIGSRGLDAGCGIGFQTLLLAEAVGTNGHVVGLDISPDLLAYAEQMVEKSDFSGRISFQQGDVCQLPFETNSHDWVWSVDCVGYIPLEPIPLIKELVRVVKPGGYIAILAWSSEKLLPGYPVLEARLNNTAAGIAPFVRGQEPTSHFMRAPGWLHEVGLEEVIAHTFVEDAYAPLTAEIRSALIELLEMRWHNVESELSPADWLEYKRLCQVGSPDFILDHLDYYAFFTYSMFHGKVAK
ncbi:MAG: methyltransferase domain-containing protein [Anaerolineaceae bacterium]|nr:methyltransferase domain-containing protein [Anaerolineaceae bacterium]